MKTIIWRQKNLKIRKNVTWGHFANLLDSYFFVPNKYIMLAFHSKTFCFSHKSKEAIIIEEEKNCKFYKIKKNVTWGHFVNTPDYFCLA